VHGVCAIQYFISVCTSFKQKYIKIEKFSGPLGLLEAANTISVEHNYYKRYYWTLFIFIHDMTLNNEVFMTVAVGELQYKQ